MENDIKKEQQNIRWANPLVGTVLMVMASLTFFFMCMILSLVGPTGSKEVHGGKNLAAFICILLLTFLLSGAATYSKLQRRKIDQSPLPLFAMGLSGLCLLIFVVLITGGFTI